MEKLIFFSHQILLGSIYTHFSSETENFREIKLNAHHHLQNTENNRKYLLTTKRVNLTIKCPY